jgi:hypothetical protein
MDILLAVLKEAKAGKTPCLQDKLVSFTRGCFKELDVILKLLIVIVSNRACPPWRDWLGLAGHLAFTGLCCH